MNLAYVRRSLLLLLDLVEYLQEPGRETGNIRVKH